MHDQEVSIQTGRGDMTVKVWKGGGYGIRVGKSNALRFFPKAWKTMDVMMGGHTHTFNLSQIFWTTCPEFRGKVIEQWLWLRGAITWRHRKPPAFTLTLVRGQVFRLH
jgi:hypothetical protein